MHRSYLKLNRWDTARRWEKVLSEKQLAKEVREASEIRFYGADLEHQLRVLRATGHTGYPPQ